jgi:response regulator of citrate/malate metabolism
VIRTLVVEDEKVAAQAHAQYVREVPGFEVAAVAMSAQEAARVLREEAIDLVLLDMHLPDGHGLELLRRLRAAGSRVDVIAVTSARDVEIVRDAVAQGVVGYLIKPFAFGALRERLTAYRTFHEGLQGADDLDQGAVDRMLESLRPVTRSGLPKGLGVETLQQVKAVLAEHGAASAGELAEHLGSSRVTARRYLEHLAETGEVQRVTRLGRAGRPEVEYRPHS